MQSVDKPFPGSIAQFASTLKYSKRDFKDWLFWPPDVFALTSILMQRTGCYRIALIEVDKEDVKDTEGTNTKIVNKEDDAGTEFNKSVTTESNSDNLKSGEIFYWESGNWQKHVEDIGYEWINVVGNAFCDIGNKKNTMSWADALENFEKQKSKDNPKVEKYNLKNLEYCWEKIWQSKINIEKLRIVSTDSYDSLQQRSNEYTEKDFKECRKLAVFIAKVHAFADDACKGFGLINEYSDTSLNSFVYSRQINVFAKMTANLLLVSTGSLSTFPKFQGVVLPKMRTPQVGYVLRSMSHHLSFHTTEVEIIWRTIPWLNASEKSLNILAVPLPFEISEDDFEIVPEQYNSVRYFRPKLNFDESFKLIDDVIDLVITQHKKGSMINMIIFPEAALKHDEYQYLLNKFHKRLERDDVSITFKLPMIVAGVVGGVKNDANDEVAMQKLKYINNEVRVACYFAGRWYDVNQRKHHRWQLDRSQILQYDLQNKLVTERNWFEYTSVSQRRITFLAPNNWLVLTALICEDLARLEPVTEVIRGVAPTFLTALLSDGPQLTKRWSARYASVLADDPGTAVLSLTSYGMSIRSKTNTDEFKWKLPEKETTVGLWKDAISGYKQMQISDQKKALLITIAAKFKEEFTLDARSDGEFASVFEIEGVKELNIPDGSHECQSSIIEKLVGNWEDIRQLSIFVFTLDTAIDLLLFDIQRNKDANEVKRLFFGWWDLILDILDMQRIKLRDRTNLATYEPYIKKTDRVNGSTDTQGTDFEDDTQHNSLINLLEEIRIKIRTALQEPISSGVGARNYNDEWPSNEVLYAFSIATLIFKNTLKEVFSKIDLKTTTCISTILLALFDQAKKVFDQENNNVSKNRKHLTSIQIRVRLAVPVVVVMAIDNKISDWRIEYPSNLAEILQLRKMIKEFLDESYKKVRVAK